MNYAVRVSAGYDSLARMVSRWSLECDKVAVYEHVGDETEKVHIHALLLGCRVTSQQLKNYAAELGHVFKGNSAWSMKTTFKDYATKKKVDVSPETAERNIVYMSKGKFDAKFFKGFTKEYLDECKVKWVDLKTMKSAATKDAMLFDRFMDFVEDQNVKEFKEVRAYAVQFAFKEFGQIWSVNTAKCAKMCTITYCMREGISMDLDMKMSMF